jgi:dTDP-4-dehydrorhamnose reductase
VRRILITGKNGQVGWELQHTLSPLGQVIALDRSGLDISDADSIRTVIRETKPAITVNAAAYTSVDRAESESALAMAVNGEAPGILAEEVKRLNGLLVHYSTDYVFDGTKSGPYTEEDAPKPLNAYGKSKHAGECAVRAAGVPHLIFRTSWVYGARGRNFLLTVLRLAEERDEIRIVNDQIGAPTWCRTIAEATAQVISRCDSLLNRDASCMNALSGTYHLSAAGDTSWYGFAQTILKHAPPRIAVRAPRLSAIRTVDYPLPAHRPANSVLSNAKLQRTFGVFLPMWEDACILCMEDLRQIESRPAGLKTQPL